MHHTSCTEAISQADKHKSDFPHWGYHRRPPSANKCLKGAILRMVYQKWLPVSIKTQELAPVNPRQAQGARSDAIAVAARRRYLQLRRIPAEPAPSRLCNPPSFLRVVLAYLFPDSVSVEIPCQPLHGYGARNICHPEPLHFFHHRSGVPTAALLFGSVNCSH
ncbi:hypothetical protein CANTEDRAFT_116125 [Yamadazyma tenuis ATCC 10573]|uniref:Uncharacterized protein n=1 Tax=Candida tenuis (strain ATCC 10573 / BCRC 21748 / CBS 615 / JCM 9827 / NBRC 10315 / NRRL Y-1498 / VKM Y-70) TaxID=590646 RepID=G3BBY1_CANTC|nr:uncharacterized protein CANTEDRAFT_116125 [Yamadazyma tenuis ATCC 10573]EGV60111.1 hypothetical protein CANTEDRAFT_116125 [Yamadazyma tenuis ATCC 10573]